MTNEGMKFLLVASTAGSVINKVLESDFFRRHVHSLVVDRDCEAIAKAQAHGIEVEKIIAPTVEEFCDRLEGYATAHGIDYILSYYTNFYSKKFRDAFEDRIVNFHPSLLPAFKGMDGFGDAVDYHVRFVGNTVEFIADVMDEGKIIMQTVCPLDTNAPPAATRHVIFIHQCQALLQVARWLSDGRISVTGRRVDIAGAAHDCPNFSPALDDQEAIGFAVNI